MVKTAARRGVQPKTEVPTTETLGELAVGAGARPSEPKVTTPQELGLSPKTVQAFLERLMPLTKPGKEQG